MRAEIYIEDAEDGEAVDVKFEFLGGFKQESGAHKMANMIRAYLDTVMEARGGTPMETIAVKAGPVVALGCKMLEDAGGEARH